MFEAWNSAIITDIALAIYVKPDTGKATHVNRAFHGFVINDGTAEKDIYFSDGTVLHSRAYEVHYLPKYSSYNIKKIQSGGCWAINFDVLEEIREKPFSIKIRNHEAIIKIFKDSVDAWKEKSDISNTVIRKNLYDIIIKLNNELHRNYAPLKKQNLIAPAVNEINRRFTENDLTVKHLSELCNITEAYFRRIFIDTYSLSPKEYIIKLRLDYAKQLLETKEFSVTEVAQLCGYYEPCHFSREFKKHCGVSPTEYAKAVD